MATAFNGKIQDSTAGWPTATAAGTPLSSAAGTKGQIGPYNAEIRSDRIFRRIDPNPPAGVTAQPILEYRVQDSDTGDGGTENPRGQLDAPAVLAQTGAVCYGISVWLPADFPTTITSPTGNTFLNLHSLGFPPYNPSPISIRAVGGTFRLGWAGEVPEASGGYGYVASITRAEAVGKWVGMIERHIVNSASTGQGTMEMWVNVYGDGQGWRKLTTIQGGTTYTGRVQAATNGLGDSRIVLYRKYDLNDAGTNRVTTVRHGGHVLVNGTDWTQCQDLYPFNQTSTPVTPPVTPPVTTTSLATFTDSFDGTAVSSSNWPTITGSPTVANSSLILQPVSGGAQGVTSAAAYDAPTHGFMTGPWGIGAVTAGTGEFETRAVLYADKAAGNYAVLKVVKSDVDSVGTMFCSVAKGGDQDPALPLAVGIPFNATTMAYRRITPAANGSDLVFATSPDGTNWTTQRSVTATWTLTGVAAQAEVFARVNLGTPGVSPSTIGGVNLVSSGAPPPPVGGSTGTAKLPSGLANGDLIVMHIGAGNPAATIDNAADLPFDDLLGADFSSYAGVSAGSTVKEWLLIKRYDPATDTADWSVNFSVATEWAIETTKISGADSSAADYGVDLQTTQAYVAASSFATSAIASSVAGARFYIFAAADTDAVSGTWGAAPGSMTRLYEAKQSSGGVDIAAYAETITAAGTSVARTISHAAAGGVAAVLAYLFVRPGQTTTSDVVVTQSKLDAAALAVASTRSGNYTLALADASTVVEMTSASAQVVTVPPNSTAAFPIGTLIELGQYGTGSVTLAAGAGVTIRSNGGLLAVSGQYRSVVLRKRGTNEWMLEGSLA